MCHYTDRKNRPNQHTFCCVVCGYRAHADENAATNIAQRVGDTQLAACRTKQEVKALIMGRHEAWKRRNGWP